MKKNIIGFMLGVLMLMSTFAGLVGAEESITTSATKNVCGALNRFILNDEETGTFTVNGMDYEIKAHVEAEDNWASFNVNGEVTNGLFKTQSATLADGSGITVYNIGYDNNEFVEFCIKGAKCKDISD